MPLQFGAGNRSYLWLGDAAQFDPLNNTITVGAWVNRDNTGTIGYIAVRGTGASGGWRFGWANDAGPLLFFSKDGVGGGLAEPGPQSTAGVWEFVFASISTTTMRLGKVSTGGTVTGGNTAQASAFLAPAVNQTTIGGAVSGGEGTSVSQTWSGRIANLAVWQGQALTDAQLTAFAMAIRWPNVPIPSFYVEMDGGRDQVRDLIGRRATPIISGTNFSGASDITNGPAGNYPPFPKPRLALPRVREMVAAASPPITISAPPATLTFSAAAPPLGRIATTSPAATLTFSAPAPSLNRYKINAPPASMTLSSGAPKLVEKIRPPVANVSFSVARPAIVLDGFKVVVTPGPLATFSAPAPTIIISGGVGAIPATTVAQSTNWRLVLCDLNGRPISVVSTLARQKQIVAQLNRPMQASFVISADDERVNELHSDGLPYFWPGARTMKWYRQEGTNWVLRFAGYVWTINPAERDADSSVVDIDVTCFDPFQRLMKRLCRDAAGSFASTVKFTSTPGATIAKALVDRTIAYGGPLGIATSGTFGGSTTPQTVTYDQAFVAQALINLTNTMTLDVIFQPVDRTDGILASMGAIAQRGVDRPAVIFGYDAIPHSALGFNRSLSMDDFANDITIYSGASSTAKKKALSAHRAAANSKSVYGTYEDAQVYTEITEQLLLDALADTDIQLRKNPRDLVGIRPVPGRSPSPWLDWWLGDRVLTRWSSNTGAAGSGIQRIYGTRLSIDDQNFERVEELLVSADAESA